jgi:hypothetical protein
MCPVCQVLCDETESCGVITCLELIAQWACRKPTNCTQPTCVLQCEQPPDYHLDDQGNLTIGPCRYQGPFDPWKVDEKISPGLIFIIACIGVLGLLSVLFKK